MIDFDTSIKLSDCTAKQRVQLVKIVNLRLGAYNSQLQDGLSKYIWKFGDKCVPLLILKEDNRVELANSVYTNKFIILLPCSKSVRKEGYRIPIFAYHDLDVLANLYYYNYEAFKSQIDDAEINEFTSGALLECVLIMINVFDLNSDSHFLALAEYLLKLLEPFITEELIVLNRLQIKKRTSELSKDDLEALKGIESDEIDILFGKSALIGDKVESQKYFELLAKEIQSKYKSFPIYKLYCQLRYIEKGYDEWHGIACHLSLMSVLVFAVKRQVVSKMITI